MRPSVWNSRYFTPSVHSANLVAMPRKPDRNNQNATPGPPIMMPMATPAMLPRPTVPETAALRAWKWEISPGIAGVAVVAAHRAQGEPESADVDELEEQRCKRGPPARAR